MRGKPKYKINDIITIKYDDIVKTGIVAIVDKFGTFFDNSDVSYDIFVKEENTLIKHINEKYVVKKVGQFDDNVWSYL